MRDHLGIPQSHWAAGREVHRPPKAHVFVRRKRIPVHERYREVIFFGSFHFHRQRVFPSRQNVRRDIELVDAP